MYNRTDYIRPFRQGNTVLNETALVVEYHGITDKDGNITLTLLYDIEKIISVTDFGGKKINGKSIMNIMAGCIKCGSEITVECNGADENEMLKKAEELITSGFGEE